MNPCDFALHGTHGKKFVYRCTQCGRITAPTGSPPDRVHARCRKEVPSGWKPGWFSCPHRGPVLATINARSAGCGCSSTNVEVYQCERFREPVLKQAAERCREKIAEAVPGYTGRTCRECKPETLPAYPPAPQTIGVVVTCHNYGRFLRQCLDSILAQTVRPASIILVDDASSDDTPAIASEYTQRGVRYERVEHRDAPASRNHGAAVAGKPQFLLFVDADNWLPQNYLAELLRHATEPNVGVVYCRLWRVDAVGEPIGFSPATKTYSLAAIRRHNLADTCSLVRRQALEQVGGWNRDRWGLQDWDLWLRIAAAGWGFRYAENVALNYRIHGQQMSKHVNGHWESGMEVMRDSQLTAMVTLFSGRGWSLYRWFADLRALRWKKENLHLVAVDNSRNPDFSRELKDQLENCGSSYTYLRDDSRINEAMPSAEFTDLAQQRIASVYRMNIHIGRLYSLATRYLPAAAANVWSVEDDVGFSPDTLEVLATEMYRLQPVAASGCLRNRFAERNLLSWVGVNQAVKEPPQQSIQVTGTGFFCLLARRDAWDKIAWRAGTTGDKHPYYDWAASHDLRQQGPIYLTPVRCVHWQADGTGLEC